MNFMTIMSHIGFLSWSHLSSFCSWFLFLTQTEKGSALHEAALFGKADVVQKLLSAGQTSVVFHQHDFSKKNVINKNPHLTFPVVIHQVST